MKDHVCTSCGHLGTPVKQSLESFLLDVLLWGSFISISLLTGLFPLMVIPVIWTIYHIANFTSKCPACGDLEMAAVTSNKGRDYLARKDNIQVWKPEETEYKKAA